MWAILVGFVIVGIKFTFRFVSKNLAVVNRTCWCVPNVLIAEQVLLCFFPTGFLWYYKSHWLYYGHKNQNTKSKTKTMVWDLVLLWQRWRQWSTMCLDASSFENLQHLHMEVKSFSMYFSYHLWTLYWFLFFCVICTIVI